ncbi:replication protein A 70 isoform X2 [Oratosquilla oratoria]|uniref:replication protein A 70 isoform X2 n=1 Tax=Oratosquilla oratoria TaxID=337810 RepID=UPI003F76E7BA
MAYTLTEGAIADINNGVQVPDPVLQILSLKPIPNNAQERFRLLISDGVFSSSFAMLATQHNAKVHSGEIGSQCIIRMDRYVVNSVQDNKKVLIVLDLTVIAKGDEVGRKIGEPQTYDASKVQGKKPAAPAPSKPMQSSAQRNEPAVNRSPARPANIGNVHPIASLTPYQNKWTICARVTNKSSIRTWSNSRGEGKLFSMDLLDESGEIKATAFNDQCDKFFDMIEVNKVYYISVATLKAANKQYSSLKNDYEMSFNGGTQVMPCEDESSIPQMQFEFVSLDQLERLEKDTILDVIGICKEVMDISTVTQRSTNRELKKRDLQIVDDTNREVRLTLWGNQAETFDGSLQPVVAVKGAKLSDYNGRSLSLLASSSLQLNPDIREAHKLRGWYDNVGCKTETVNLSNQRGSGGAGMGSNFKTFGEAKLEGLGSGDAADYYTIKATVVLIRKENCLYTACPSDGCNKKVIDMNNGFYRCEKCNREYDTFKWRLMVSANLADATNNQWVTMFQDQAEAVLGMPAQDIGNMRESNNDAFLQLFHEATFKNHIFRLRVKMETYQDESRLKTTAMAVNPLDPKEYNRRLITDIKSMMDA